MAGGVRLLIWAAVAATALLLLYRVAVEQPAAAAVVQPPPPPAAAAAGRKRGRGRSRHAEPALELEVARRMHHDSAAFTQGFLLRAGPHGEGELLESTGLYGHSSLRRLSADTGAELQRVMLPPRVFGEGVVEVGERILVLTWREKQVLEYSSRDLSLVGQHRFRTITGEGWGMTFDGRHIVVSDGSQWLYFWDPDTLEEVRRVAVHAADTGAPLKHLNELEFVDGEILANVWYKDFIARIDPETGDVLGAFNLEGLHPRLRRHRGEDVLNGIAYDAAARALIVTGKLWDAMYVLPL